MDSEEAARKLFLQDVRSAIKENNKLYENQFRTFQECKNHSDLEKSLNFIARRKNDHKFYLSELNDLGYKTSPKYLELNYMEILN